MPMPKQILHTPSLACPPYAAMTIRETMLEPTNPEMMAALVDTATNIPRCLRMASVLSAHSKAWLVQTAYSPPASLY
jgi:hypothetical protein